MICSSVQTIYHDLAKWLSYYLYFFSFSFGLTTWEGVWEIIMSQVSHSYNHMIRSHNVTLKGYKRELHTGTNKIMMC